MNDHERLRFDPVFAIALGKLSQNQSESVLLAGKSTLNRLEYCPERVIEQATSRYHRISHNPQEIERLLVELCLESYRKPPRCIVLDLDVTDDSVHRNQEQAFFNTYYRSVCYAPLYIFCGHHLLAAKLRASNVDPAAGAREELQRVIALIRQQWKQTHILIRGDSAYSRDEIMSWCEEQPGVDYVFGLATNNQLRMRASDIIAKAQADYEQRLTPVTCLMEKLFRPDEDLSVAEELVRETLWYRSLSYKTQTSWSRNASVVTKVTYDSQGLKMRFVVTSLPAAKIPPGLLYTNKYCPRGEMENRIKEQQLELFSDRTSTHTFEGNQLRLWFSAIAYELKQTFRQQCLTRTPLATATVGTIRTLLLKLGTRVLSSVRRVLISIFL